MRSAEAGLRARIFERTVCERQMIFLHHPTDADETVLVVGNAEAYGIRRIRGHPSALLPGVAEIAKLLHGGRIRRPLVSGRRAANARPGIAQRHGRYPFPGGLWHAFDRIETRTHPFGTIGSTNSTARVLQGALRLEF